MFGAGVNVNHRGLHKGVAELFLDGQQMRSTMKQASRQTVSKQMRVYPFLQVGIPGATEQKIRLRNQESSSIASDELRRGRSCPRWTASGTEKA